MFSRWDCDKEIWLHWLKAKCCSNSTWNGRPELWAEVVVSTIATTHGVSLSCALKSVGNSPLDNDQWLPSESSTRACSACFLGSRARCQHLRQTDTRFSFHYDWRYSIKSQIRSSASSINNYTKTYYSRQTEMTIIIGRHCPTDNRFRIHN